MPNEYPIEDPSSAETLGIQAASVQSLLQEEQASVGEAIADSAPAPDSPTNNSPEAGWEQYVADLHRQVELLKQDVSTLQTLKTQLQEQVFETEAAVGKIMQDGLRELEQRKRDLQITIEQLERRQERIREEMRTTFAGASQELAIRVQSFKEYLVGSLQDLALAAEQLDFPQPTKEPERQAIVAETPAPTPALPKFAEQTFQDQTKQIRGLIDQYRNRPDYYGAPWQLRRTFEPIHAERVSNWFFTQGDGAQLERWVVGCKNILIASAIVSILRSLYDDRLVTLVLAESPERLGEWRRGLQDCLGITRADFGTDRGAALFEDPIVLTQKADRLQKDGYMPLIIIDETEAKIDLAILQFPLWLAFASNPQTPSYSRDWI